MMKYIKHQNPTYLIDIGKSREREAILIKYWSVMHHGGNFGNIGKM